MRKIVFLIIFIISFVYISVIFTRESYAACQCTNWQQRCVPCCTWRRVNGVLKYVCGQCCTSYCAAQDCSSVTCGPGYYPCNNGCCPIGTGGGGGGGGGGASNSPTGRLESSSCTSSIGWSCDGDNTNQSLSVNFYANGPVGTGTLIGTATTGVSRPDVPLAGSCGTNQNTGYEFPTPDYVIDGLPHTIYAYGVNIGSTGANSLLTGSPKTITCTPSCTIDLLPETNSFTAGSSIPLQASIVANDGVVTQVNFSSQDTNIVTVSPTSDTTASYTTTATGINSGTTTVTASAVISGNVWCSDTAFVSVLNVTPWWQVKDGDVSTNGTLTSSVPSGEYFNTIGSGGYAGLPVFGTTFNLSADSTKISTSKWNANSLSTESRLFDYSYFKNLIPANTLINDIGTIASGGTPTDGYEWYKVSGNLDINSDIDFGTRKVILFVENGDLNINAKINLTDNTGFFGAFVNGKITVAPTVTSITPAIEGVYLADSTFDSGVGGTSQLYVRGSVAAFGGMTLSRDLTDNSDPAELFEFAPDQILLFPDKLGYRQQKWVEVAP